MDLLEKNRTLVLKRDVLLCHAVVLQGATIKILIQTFLLLRNEPDLLFTIV